MHGLDYYQGREEKDDITCFVMNHSGLVKKIAHSLKAKLPSTVELDDLIQSGLIGLLDAKNTYLSSKGAAFETYAGIKIRGAMIDNFRKNSGMTRDLSQSIKKIARATSDLQNANPESVHPISRKEIAQQMGLSLEKYDAMASDIHTYHAIHAYHDTAEEISPSIRLEPLYQTEQDDTHAHLKQLISQFPKRDQQLLALYYNEQLTFKQIADVLSLTEARVSQLHRLLLEKIKRRFPMK